MAQMVIDPATLALEEIKNGSLARSAQVDQQQPQGQPVEGFVGVDNPAPEGSQMPVNGGLFSGPADGMAEIQQNDADRKSAWDGIKNDKDLPLLGLMFGLSMMANSQNGGGLGAILGKSGLESINAYNSVLKNRAATAKNKAEEEYKNSRMKLWQNQDAREQKKAEQEAAFDVIKQDAWKRYYAGDRSMDVMAVLFPQQYGQYVMNSRLASDKAGYKTSGGGSRSSGGIGGIDVAAGAPRFTASQPPANGSITEGVEQPIAIKPIVRDLQGNIVDIDPSKIQWNAGFKPSPYTNGRKMQLSKKSGYTLEWPEAPAASGGKPDDTGLDPSAVGMFRKEAEKQLKDDQKIRNESISAIESIDKAITPLQNGVKTGPFFGLEMTARQMGRPFGFGNSQRLAEMESLQSAMEYARLNAAKYMKGAISDKEQEILKRAAGGTDLSREGLLEILNTMRAIEQRNLGRVDSRREYAAKHGHLNGWKDPYVKQEKKASAADFD